jgi:putative peptidoglycan lipid II flippase
MMSRLHNLHTLQLVNAMMRCALASVILAFVCWATLFYFEKYINHASMLIRAVSLFSAIGVAGVAYLLACSLLRVEGVQASAFFHKARGYMLRFSSV